MAERPFFLTANWENLIMVNYEVDPAVLLPWLPAYTQLDLYNGKALVSLVGFMFTRTRVFGIRWPFHNDFEEVNLRFYVKHFDGTGWKRGVVFISEIVPKHIISFFANKLYHEPYKAMPMRHHHVISGEQQRVQYEWYTNRKWNKIAVDAEASLSYIEPCSMEEFIFEHYWGYNKFDGTTTIEYGVEHIMWQVSHVQQWTVDCDIAFLYGHQFVPFIHHSPSSVFLAKGSPVIIRKPVFIRKGIE